MPGGWGGGGWGGVGWGGTSGSPPFPEDTFGLRASSGCQGNRVDLTWTVPAGTQHIKVVRRPKNNIFALDDVYDVLYDSTVLINVFIDTGVLLPSTILVADVTAGDTSVTVVSDAGFVVGDLIRIEQLEGPLAYDIVSITGLPGGNVINIDPVTNDYEVSLDNRVAKSKALIAQTFYYYTVLFSPLLAPVDSDYFIQDANQTAGLSIAPIDSKNDFFWANTPVYFRERDVTDGGNFLDRMYSVMGCWLNQMRGWANALSLMGDDDEAPFNSMVSKVESLGIDPEGYGYDYEVPRRSQLSLVDVYHVRGTCEGMIRTARMFAKWESECVEFGFTGCNDGLQPVQTWDGTSLAYGNEFFMPDPLYSVVNRTFTDPTAAFAVDIWKDGVLYSGLGDECCVDTNTATTITLKPTKEVALLSAPVLSGAVTIPLTSTVGMLPGLTVQLEQDPTFLVAEIGEILSTVPGVSITLRDPIVNGYAAGDKLSVQKSLVRYEVLGSGTWATVSGTVRRLTDATALWVENQWKERIVLTIDNIAYTVIANTGTTLDIDTAVLPTNGVYSIASDFTLGGTFALRTPILAYRVFNGTHSFTFEPTRDMQARGTIYDPFFRLWQGPGIPIFGAWRSGDVGLYITTPVTQTLGYASTVAGNVLDLDPNVVAPVINALVGMYLNPNQNQSQMFEIIANTGTTITVAEIIASLVVPGQAYFVLKPRDTQRYRRLTSRLGPPAREFAHSDIDVHILFA